MDEPDVEVVEDPKSPDGKRVLYHSRQAQADMRYELWELAGRQCEAADELDDPSRHPKHDIPLSKVVPHHIFGRGLGGAWREDRPVVMGKRMIRCVCREGHNAIHEHALRRDRQG